jgi:hypothetical protein
LKPPLALPFGCRDGKLPSGPEPAERIFALEAPQRAFRDAGPAHAMGPVAAGNEAAIQLNSLSGLMSGLGHDAASNSSLRASAKQPFPEIEAAADMGSDNIPVMPANARIARGRMAKC